MTIQGRKLSFKIADGGSIDSVESGKLTKLSSSLRSMSEPRFSQVCSAVDGTIFPRLGVCLECRALSSVARVTSFDGTQPTSRESKSCCIEMQPAMYSTWIGMYLYAASSLGTVQYINTKSSKTEFWGRVPLPRTYSKMRAKTTFAYCNASCVYSLRGPPEKSEKTPAGGRRKSANFR